MPNVIDDVVISVDVGGTPDRQALVTECVERVLQILRRLVGRAGEQDTPEAPAPQDRLREATDQINAAMQSALDATGPGDLPIALHPQRTELALTPAFLGDDDTTLRQAIRALVEREWNVLSAGRGTPVVPFTVPARPEPMEMAQHLRGYLASGVLHEPLAGLDHDRLIYGLRHAALALMESDDPLRLGMRAGDLAARTGWFRRLLELWPEPDRMGWMQRQVDTAQGHAMAASPLHDTLDQLLFDPRLPESVRLELMSLWLAAMAPGAVSLDAERRKQDLLDAERLAASAFWAGIQQAGRIGFTGPL